ncbi:hypothetical protein ISS04_03430 [Candidatus Woesearchaeota archaeon]|nr:hypothetical protein [Candidatus Woesearchaeota archaeon]
MEYKNMIRYETFIIVGIIVAVLSFLNVLGLTKIPSDFFWTLAGLGLVIEGFIENHKWRKNKKRLLESDRKMFGKR